MGRIKVLTDAKWLEFILSQIINNSIKYQRIDVASEIKIEVKVNGDQIFLSILDNGIGIPEGDIPRVFEKLLQEAMDDLEQNQQEWDFILRKSYVKS